MMLFDILLLLYSCFFGMISGNCSDLGFRGIIKGCLTCIAVLGGLIWRLLIVELCPIGYILANFYSGMFWDPLRIW